MTLCDRSLLESCGLSHLDMTRGFIRGFGPYPVMYFYSENPQARSPFAHPPGDGADCKDEDSEEPGDVLMVMGSRFKSRRWAPVSRLVEDMVNAAQREHSKALVLVALGDCGDVPLAAYRLSLIHI